MPSYEEDAPAPTDDLVPEPAPGEEESSTTNKQRKIKTSQKGTNQWKDRTKQTQEKMLVQTQEKMQMRTQIWTISIKTI